MQRLSGMDASFLYVETPQVHMQVAMLAIVDPRTGDGPPLDQRRIIEHIRSRLHLIPLLTRRVLTVPFNLHHPVWVEDPEFDIIHHVRQVTVAPPGDAAALADLVGRICSAQLPRTRPLWEVWILDGLEGGQLGLLFKVHHAAVDGTSGANLFVNLLDVTRKPRKVRPPSGDEPPELPSDAELALQALRDRLEDPPRLWNLTRRTVSNVWNLLERRLDPDKPHAAMPFSAPRTRFNRAIGARRRAALTRLPLEDVKAIKNAAECKVNDVVLAICAGALRRYLLGRGELPTVPLIAACPVSVRAAEDLRDANNRVSVIFVTLATDIDDPGVRLTAIARSTRGAKDEHDLIGAETLQRWAQFAAPTTFHLASRAYSHWNLANAHRPVYNVVISNVPGPRFPLYLAGGELDAVYPMGPVMEGAGLNVTAMSYRDSIDIGVLADARSIPDLEELAAGFEPAFEELKRSWLEDDRTDRGEVAS